MLAALALMLAAVAPPSQESAAAPAVESRLDALIEKTNALQAFRARYVLRREGEEPAEFELAYLAPGRAQLSIEREEAGRVVGAHTWVVDGTISARVEGPDGSLAAGDLDLREPAEEVAAATALLEQRFPREGAGIGPGPVFQMSWGINAETEKTDFELQLAYLREDRSALLSWLRLLRATGAEPASEGDLMLFQADERIRVALSGSTGFVQSLHMIGLDGKTAEIELLELQLDHEPDPQIFVVPARSEGASEMFSEGAGRLRGHPADLRKSGYRRVNHFLVKGRRTWDEGVREDWREFLLALHEGFLPLAFEDWAARARQQIDQFAERLAQEAANPARIEELREIATQWREDLDGSLSDGLRRFSASLWQGGIAPGDLEHLDELREIELQVLAKLFDELVRDPLLDAVDSYVTAALGE